MGLVTLFLFNTSLTVGMVRVFSLHIQVKLYVMWCNKMHPDKPDQTVIVNTSIKQITRTLKLLHVAIKDKAAFWFTYIV